MAGCGVNVPLEDIVDQIIRDYGDKFAEEIIKRLDLSKYVTVDDGIAKGLTLKSSLIADERVKSDLCSMLQDCIAAKIQEELGCDRDNHVIQFYIDREQDAITIVMAFGEVYRISKSDLKTWLDIQAGGVKSGSLVLNKTDPKQVLHLINKDNSEVDIDLSALKDTRIVSGKVVDGTVLHLVDSEDNIISIDLSKLDDLAVTSGEIVDGKIIRLHRTDKSVVDINASTLVPESSPYIISGTFVTRKNNKYIDFKRNDGELLSVDMTNIIDSMTNEVYNRVMSVGYKLNSVSEDYKLVESDFDGRTIVRADKDGDQTLVITKPMTENFVGKAIIVRKTNGNVGTFTTLTPSAGVVLSPEDSTVLRRVGSSVTLIYAGGGVYDIFGELP